MKPHQESEMASQTLVSHHDKANVGFKNDNNLL